MHSPEFGGPKYELASPGTYSPPSIPDNAISDVTITCDGAAGPGPGTSSQEGPFVVTKLGDGYCSDWRYLPEGGYPARLAAGHALAHADPLQECAARCFAQGAGLLRLAARADKCELRALLVARLGQHVRQDLGHVQ